MRWKTTLPLFTGTTLIACTAILKHRKVYNKNISKETDDDESNDIPVDSSILYSLPKDGIIVFGSNRYGHVLSSSRGQEYQHILKGLKFRDVSLANRHAAAIDQKGNLLQWGASFVSKQVLNKPPPSSDDIPEDIKSAPFDHFDDHEPEYTLRGYNLVRLASNDSLVYGLSSNGSVYAISANKQTEIERRGETDLDRHVSWFQMKPWPNVEKLPTPTLKRHERIVSIQTRSKVLVALSNFGRVLEYVDNAWTEVNLPPVRKSASGTHHSLALSSDGVVFGWGANALGQLGLLNTVHTHVSSPKPIAIPKKLTSGEEGTVADIYAGGDTSFFIVNGTSEVNVWSTGVGRWGQLGNNTNAHVSTSPAKIHRLSMKQYVNGVVKPVEIEKIEVGPTHVVAILKTNQGDENVAVSGRTELFQHGMDVLAWGLNKMGECGPKTSRNVSITAPEWMILDDRGERVQLPVGGSNTPTHDIRLATGVTAIFRRAE